MQPTRRARIGGLVGIGLEADWKQFAGLYARVAGYVGQVAAGLGAHGVAVVSLGLGRLNSLPDRRAMAGKWLAWCGTCPVPEIADVLRRAGFAVHQVARVLHDDSDCWNEVASWMQGFVNAWNTYGPAHDCAVGIGPCAASLEKVASLLNTRAVRVC